MTAPIEPVDPNEPQPGDTPPEAQGGFMIWSHVKNDGGTQMSPHVLYSKGYPSRTAVEIAARGLRTQNKHMEFTVVKAGDKPK